MQSAPGGLRNQMESEMATIQVTCTRCNGSGSFSFNLRDGTKCYGCNGAGRMVVDAKAHAKKLATAAKRKQLAESQRQAREAMAAAVSSELDAELGPFADDARGAYDRVMACQRTHGKTPGQIVQERLCRA